jgi:hypothetical protein
VRCLRTCANAPGEIPDSQFPSEASDASGGGAEIVKEEIAFPASEATEASGRYSALDRGNWWYMV